MRLLQPIKLKAQRMVVCSLTKLCMPSTKVGSRAGGEFTRMSPLAGQ
jgi:hypothetical protein